MLPGLVMQFGKKWQGVTGKFQFELFEGRVDYEGQTQSGIPLKTKTDERIRTFEATLNFDVKFLSRYDVGVIAGIGYREWRRDILATNITNSLLEIYRWKYFTLGSAATFWQGGDWSAGIDVRLLRPVSPTMAIYIAGFDEAVLDLKPRNSARISFPVRFMTGTGQQWTIMPYWEAWRMDRSDGKRLTIGGVPTAFTVTEPRNETNIVGVTLSTRFSP